MKCEDCIHYEICKDVYVGFEYIDMYLMMKNSTNSENWCDLFKDKSRFVELPCKVDDEMWFVYSPKFPANPQDKGKWFIVRDGVQRMIYGKKGFSIESWNFGTKSAKELGRTIFFTKAEAEARLKELEREQK